ncbi:MAG TPA: hypothetical protein VIA18_00745 [Polyangia bacterium]|nr:hypothetical protein [Polyangia bacterium]
MSATSMLALGAVGCSHTVDQARADYHQDKADRAADHGRYIKAAHEQRAADIDERKAEEAPLP